MAADVPVVTTNAGSLPEVVGGRGRVRRSRRRRPLADALHRVLGDEALRATLVERGHRRVHAFPWSTAIDGFVDLYRRVAVGDLNELRQLSRARGSRSMPKPVRMARYIRPVAAITAEYERSFEREPRGDDQADRGDRRDHPHPPDQPAVAVVDRAR